MKIFLALLLFTVSAHASHYGDVRAIQSCLKSWGKTPFSKDDPQFRTLKMKIKVLGIGGNIVDDVETKKPDLVLVKTNISVLSSTRMRLLNPKGWYCLKGKVSVLGKTNVQVACNAKIAYTNGDGANVLGSNDVDSGTTVLGTSRIHRMGCSDREETAAKEAADKDGLPPKSDVIPKREKKTAKVEKSSVKSQDIKETNADDDDED